MAKSKIVVIGATGKVGSKVSNLLLEQGYTPVLIARNAEKLKPFKEKGAKVAAFSVEDVDQLTKTLKGADAVLTMIASNATAENFVDEQRKQLHAQVEAIKNAGIKHVVNLSSVGCHVTTGNGVIQGLAEMELLLNELQDVHVIHLRPSFFMENTLYALDLIRHKGIYGLPVRGTVAFPMVATKDVATVILEKLTQCNFTGHTVFPILGPKDYTLEEITNELGSAIGKQIPYIQFPLSDFVAGVAAAGGSKDYAEKFGELMNATDKGLLNYHTRTAESTTATGFAEYASNVFAPIFNHQ
jgi:uncharacterized protein YbjT (DUF2867 family)